MTILAVIVVPLLITSGYVAAGPWVLVTFAGALVLDYTIARVLQDLSR